jgi:hypothetical protein
MVAPGPPSPLRSDSERGLVEVAVVRNTSADGSFDLASIRPSDKELIGLAMKAFNVNPDQPDARQKLARELSRKFRRARPGRRSQGLRLAVVMVLAGVQSGDTASAAAKRLARFWPNVSHASVVQMVRRWRREGRKTRGG